MSGPEEEFPILTYDQVRLSQQDQSEVTKEMVVLKTFHAYASAAIDDHAERQIKLRSFHSQYLLDPNKFRFRKVIRIFALVLSFIWKIPELFLKFSG